VIVPPETFNIFVPTDCLVVEVELTNVSGPSGVYANAKLTENNIAIRAIPIIVLFLFSISPSFVVYSPTGLCCL
jgi:hypothetical protein